MVGVAAERKAGAVGGNGAVVSMGILNAGADGNTGAEGLLGVEADGALGKN